MEKRTRDTYRLIQDTYIALMGENGDPYFEEKFKKKVCMDINRMMDAEGMPRMTCARSA